jgi:sugar phosphate isomerase/epimerase
LLASLLAAGAVCRAEPIPDVCRIGGFAIGCQAYSFNRFTVFEAIEKTELAGGKTIEFYPGQRLSKEESNVKWDHTATDAVIQKVKDKLAQHGIRAVNYGVVRIPAEEKAARQIFEFARKLGLYGLTTEAVDALDTIEKLAKEHDLRVGIHQHAKRAKDPNYKLWDPNYVLSLIKDRDPRIGACADTGHWQSSGMKAIDGLKILRGRIVSLHLKDRPALGVGQHDVPYGTGVADVPALLDELRRQKFDGHISIEYEYNWDNSVSDIAQCIGFVRGYAAARAQ